MRKNRLVAALATATLMGALVSGTASAQINDSKHDMGWQAVSETNATGTSTDNTEICVYCHTPHGSNLGIEAPLWNKTQGVSTLTSYDSVTIQGEVESPGSMSLACLSCHDGSQARDSVINAPGTGAGSGNLGTFSDGGLMTGWAAIGADSGNDSLQNDHPIGVQYSGGGYTTGTVPVKDEWVEATEGLINGNTRWWVDTAGGTASREKTDMVLYNRTFAVAGEGPSVECGSCHDPHNSSTSTATQVAFLRIANTDSDVCLSCHVK